MSFFQVIACTDLADAKVVETAKYLSDTGADALFVQIKNKEDDLTIIKDITRTVDVPLAAQLTPGRFEDAKKVLYAGAAKVCLNTENLELVKEITNRFGKEKISGIIDASKTADAVLFAKELEENGVGELLVENGTDAMLRDIMAAVTIPVILLLTAPADDCETLAQEITAKKVAGCVCTITEKAGTFMNLKNQLKKLLVAVNTFESTMDFKEFKLNENGLIPVVVQDYKTQDVLMMAYMNEEAFQKTIETGTMTYYSRSRNELWVKGLTSGHFQYVKSLTIDCDKDTILAKVAQVGAACHTGNRSCFYTDLAKKDYNDVNPLKVFEEEYQIIADRKANPKEGSYTNYLFDKGIDKILKKVGEEATEIVIAAKNPDAEELKYELCDFLYHAMVLMVECGVTWEDITKELVERR